MLKKIVHLFQRLPGCVKDLPGNHREFGLKVAGHQFRSALLPGVKPKSYIESLSARTIQELAPVTARYVRGEYTVHAPKMKLDKTPVWVCWWQGEEHMPPLVKACVAQMRQCLPDWAEVRVITWDNLESYIDFPPYILEKFRKGLITNIHLTDILRYGLMSRYGGAWIDSTVFLSDRIREKLPQYLSAPYFTQCFESWDACPGEACRGKWCNFFFMGTAGNPLFSYVYESLLLWWQNHNRLIDYVIVDYVIWAGYCGVPAIRSCIDAVTPGNEHIWAMAKGLNDPYEPEAFEALMQSNDFFKLSYKGRLDPATPDGKKTVYTHILER